MSSCWLRSLLLEEFSHCTQSLSFFFFFCTVKCTLSLSYPAACTWSLITNIKHTFSGHRDFFLVCCHGAVAFSLAVSFKLILHKREGSLPKMWWKPLFSHLGNYKLSYVHWIHFISQKQEAHRMVLLAVWMNVVPWVGLLCCQFCFWSTPCPIVSMVSFSSSPQVTEREGLVYCNDTAVVGLSWP